MATLGQIIVILVTLASIISLMVGFCWWIYPRKRRPDGKWDLSPTSTVERRYREAGHE